MKKPIILVLIIILFGGPAFFFVRKTINRVKESSVKIVQPTPSVVPGKLNLKEIPEVEFTPEELEKYYQVYKNPFVLYLRKALNAYLANDSTGVNISMAAVQKETREGIISGLNSFDKEYYRSKFIVATINDSTLGGKDIQIIFQNKQDRIFYAWVYELATGEFELRGFNSKEHFDEKKMEALKSGYEKFLNDPEHAL